MVKKKPNSKTQRGRGTKTDVAVGTAAGVGTAGVAVPALAYGILLALMNYKARQYM